MKREQKKNIEKLEQVIEEKKKIPKSVKEKINGKLFENLIIVSIIMVYLVALNLGMTNIPTDTYIVDLKVFSIMLLVATIVIFEIGYKKDDGEIWLHGVEAMTVAVLTLYLVYLYSIYYGTYNTVLLIAGIVYLIYFGVKLVVMQRRIEKEYNKSLTDIGEIVKKGKV